MVSLVLASGHAHSQEMLISSIALAQKDTSPVPNAIPPHFLPAVICPSLLNCSGNPSDHIDVVYNRPPEIITIPIFHQDVVVGPDAPNSKTDD